MLKVILKILIEPWTGWYLDAYIEKHNKEKYRGD